MKVKEFTATLTSPKYNLDKKGWIVFAIVSIIIFFVAVGIDSLHAIHLQLAEEMKDDNEVNMKIFDFIKEIKKRPTLRS